VALVSNDEVSHAQNGHAMRMVSHQKLKNVINHVLGLFLHGPNVQNHVEQAYGHVLSLVLVLQITALLTNHHQVNHVALSLVLGLYHRGQIAQSHAGLELEDVMSHVQLVMQGIVMCLKNRQCQRSAIQHLVREIFSSWGVLTHHVQPGIGEMEIHQ